MAGILKLTISESADELRALLLQQTAVSGQERIQALYLIKTGEVKTITRLSEVLGRHTSTIFRWFQRYKSEGLEGLLDTSRSPGRPPLIPGPILMCLNEKLRSRHRFRSYEEVRHWLHDQFNLDVSYKVVHETIRYRLKLQLRPHKRHAKTNI